MDDGGSDSGLDDAGTRPQASGWWKQQLNVPLFEEQADGSNEKVGGAGFGMGSATGTGSSERAAIRPHARVRVSKTREVGAPCFGSLQKGHVSMPIQSGAYRKGHRKRAAVHAILELGVSRTSAARHNKGLKLRGKLGGYSTGHVGGVSLAVLVDGAVCWARGCGAVNVRVPQLKPKIVRKQPT